MKFLIDAQLPPALTHVITSFGHRAIHVEAVQLLIAHDAAIWAYAVDQQHVIVTKDEDFKNMLLLATDRKTPVVWVRIGNCSNAALTQWFQPLFPQVLEHLQQGEYLIELY
jgi:predicted nuclease of predicted toxin-antitoxin system